MIYEDLWNRWQALSDSGDMEALNQLRKDIYDGLEQAENREERKALSALLATVQNAVWGEAKQADRLSKVLVNVEVPTFLRGR